MIMVPMASAWDSISSHIPRTKLEAVRQERNTSGVYRCSGRENRLGYIG